MNNYGLKYLHYKLFAKHRKGFSVHSPFMFRFISEVIYGSKQEPDYLKIESLRKSLLKNRVKIEVNDFGSGSKVFKDNNRDISRIAKYVLTPAKYTKLLYRIVKDSNPENIIELGTSLGISSCYLGLANPNADIYSIDACANSQKIAQKNFDELGIKNIKLINKPFSEALADLLPKIDYVDLAYIDGDHTYDGTITNFRAILPKITPESIVIIDDIHLNPGIEKAWNEIILSQDVVVSVDIFRMGILFFRNGMQKQEYIVKY